MSPSFFTSSVSKCSLRSFSRATGTISRSVKSRAVSRMRRCSSVSSKSITAPDPNASVDQLQVPHRLLVAQVGAHRGDLPAAHGRDHRVGGDVLALHLDAAEERHAPLLDRADADELDLVADLRGVRVLEPALQTVVAHVVAADGCDLERVDVDRRVRPGDGGVDVALVEGLRPDAHEPVERVGLVLGASHAAGFSTTIAMPCPTPMHIVA